MALTKKGVSAELQRMAKRFKLYASECRRSADDVPAGGQAEAEQHADWKARAEVWDGAALEVERSLAVLMVRAGAP